MLSHGADGLRQVAEDAVLNANYIMAAPADVMTPAFRALHARGAVRRRAASKGTGVTTLDFAKAMIDEGFHPMTMYFPLVVHGAMLIEPTETEAKAELDRFCDACGRSPRAKGGRRSSDFKAAPRLRPAPPPRRDAGRPQARAALATLQQPAGRRSIR